jgi:uncharacterized membrane protein YgcG
MGVANRRYSGVLREAATEQPRMALGFWAICGTLDARPPSMARIDIAAHAKYFLRCLELLPAPYASLDTNRLTVAYFCVSGLDVLGSVKRVNAARVIEWIYSLQVLPSSDSAESAAAPGRSAGFRGGSFMGGPFSAGGGPSSRRVNADPP